MIFQNCRWSNWSPELLIFDFRKEEKPFFVNGLDRIDNTKGYTENNVVPCHPKINYLKGSMPIGEFLNIGKALYETNFK